MKRLLVKSLILLSSGLGANAPSSSIELATPAAAQAQLPVTKPLHLPTIIKDSANFLALLATVKAAKTPELTVAFERCFFDSFDNLINDFLPNAATVCDQIFPLMTATQIGNAINAISSTLAKNSCFYLDTKKLPLTVSKLHCLLEQCRIFCNKLEKMYIDNATKKIVGPTKKTPKTAITQEWNATFSVNPFHCLLAARIDLLFVQMYSKVIKTNLRPADVYTFKNIRSQIQGLVATLTRTQFERPYNKALQLAINFDNYLDGSLRQLYARGRKNA